MTGSKIFFFSCIAFAGGIALAPFVSPGRIVLLAFFVLAVFLFVMFREQKLVLLAACAIAAAAFGMWRYDTANSAYENNELQAFLDSGQRVEFVSTVAQEPEDIEGDTRLVVEPDFVSAGRVLLFVEGKANWQYGDKLRVIGELRHPGEFDEFNYADFLAKDRVYATMYQPEVQNLGRSSALGITERGMALLLAFKEQTREVLSRHISLPERSILGAIVLGDKGSISEDIAEQLNAAGVRHVTAVSGMHVAVLTIYLMPAFIWLGLWRQQAFYVALSLMILYVLFTGLQASAVRAGIMGGMFLLGGYLGRPSSSHRALVIAGAGMLAFNPFLLWRDVGFQLSFLAVLGIIAFLPILSALLPKFPMRDLVGMSIAAQIFTLPILLLNFGLFSVVSVLANLLIVPTLPFLMGLGFLFLFAGLFGQAAGFLFSLPPALLLEYIMAVVRFFADLPFAALYTEHIPVFWLALFYLALALFYWKFRLRKEFAVFPHG